MNEGGKKLKYAFTEPARKRSMTTTKFTQSPNIHSISIYGPKLFCTTVTNISAQLFFSFHIVRWIHRAMNSPSKTKTLCSLHWKTLAKAGHISTSASHCGNAPRPD